jgi:hypothetical protein
MFFPCRKNPSDVCFSSFDIDEYYIRILCAPFLHFYRVCPFFQVDCIKIIVAPTLCYDSQYILLAFIL